MKTSIYKLITLSLVAFASSTSFADNARRMGGQDSGGGNTVKLSTANDVKRALEISRKYLADTFGNALTMNRDQKIWNPEDEQLAYKLWRYRDDTAKKHIIKYTTILTDAVPCLDEQGTRVDASTTIGKIGADICVDIERLQVIPRHSLVAEISGLLFHEVAHQFGAGEEQASRMQKTFLAAYDKANIFSGRGASSFHTRSALFSIHTALFLRWDPWSTDDNGNKKTEFYPTNPGTKEYLNFCMSAESIVENALSVNRALMENEQMIQPIFSEEMSRELADIKSQLFDQNIKIREQCKEFKPLSFDQLALRKFEMRAMDVISKAQKLIAE